MRELTQALGLEAVGEDFFLRTIADGNCGPRAAIQSLLLQGFLLRKQTEVKRILETMCGRHDISRSSEFQTFIAHYINCTSMNEIASFMLLYSAPSGDPQQRHPGDDVLTLITVALRDKVKIFSEADRRITGDDDEQFGIGASMDMQYAVRFFQDLGVNLVIRQRNNPSIMQAENTSETTFTIYTIFDSARGGEHYDALVPRAALNTYNLTMPRPNLLYALQAPRRIDAADTNRLLQNLHTLCMSKKHTTITAEEVLQTVVNAGVQRDATQREPLRRFVAAVNKANRKASFAGFSNAIIDFICEFVMTLFGQSRKEIIKAACNEFKNSLPAPQSEHAETRPRHPAVIQLT